MTGLDLSRAFAEQYEKILSLAVELKRSNDLHEQEIAILKEHADVIEENTAAVRENTWTLQQSKTLLCAIRDGKMKWHFWRDKGQLLRDLLGDAANFSTVAPVLVTLGKDYGPTLLKLITSLVSA